MTQTTDFLYSAKDGTGKPVQGRIRADSAKSAVERLSSLGYYPLSLREQKPRVRSGEKRIGTGELAAFTRQLSDLLASGLTLSAALETMMRQPGAGRFGRIIGGVHENVTAGRSFSECLKMFPEVFSPLFVGLVQSGERGGILKEVLESVSEYLEKEQEIRMKIVSSAAYPLLVLAAGIGTLGFLFMFVVPRLTRIFDEMNQALPLPTKVIIGTSEFLGEYRLALAAGGVLAAAAVYRLRRSRKLRVRLDAVTLNVPVWGGVVRKLEITRISRTIALCLRNGIHLSGALEAAESVAVNGVFKEEVRRLGQGIREGKSLHVCVREGGLFPDILARMIAVGEEGNTLDSVLLKIEANYLRDLDTAAKMGTALIEPIAILILGVIVALVVMAVLLPIFRMNFTLL